jgi:Xaa-Pro aminopeptidase
MTAPFPPATYARRREALTRDVGAGLVVLVGHGESPMDGPHNPYPFRQDPTFLYALGLDAPDLVATVDADDGRTVLYGREPSLDDVVWTGPQPSLAERAAVAGIDHTAPLADLPDALAAARRGGRPVHTLPAYRAETGRDLRRWLGLSTVPDPSEALVQAVVALREVKAPEEVAEIEDALAVSAEMHRAAFRATRPGRLERDVLAEAEAVMRARGRRFSFPPICTVHGETLHNHGASGRLRDGDLLLHDSGTTSPGHYASDVTRTAPVSGRFSERQRALYDLVLAAQTDALDALAPGNRFLDVHRTACRTLAAGLRDLGLLQGDPEEAVAAGAHALFFPCGTGHFVGLEAHDMEALGEDRVGYDASVRRIDQFGLRSLRLGRALRPGHVVAVEPGLYFIPALIDRWRAERRHEAFVDYDAVEPYRDAAGIRIEDVALVTDDGHRVLGPPIPKTAVDVERAVAEADR